MLYLIVTLILLCCFTITTEDTASQGKSMTVTFNHPLNVAASLVLLLPCTMHSRLKDDTHLICISADIECLFLIIFHTPSV